MEKLLSSEIVHTRSLPTVESHNREAEPVENNTRAAEPCLTTYLIRIDSSQSKSNVCSLMRRENEATRRC